ncbi:hypothetical protein L6452_17057 [Arctium lappa]|uniref:Uncharacterized protein n=1 Tax=Arctium lappa TaxID=4217 RepID=A0ACB9C2I4_ARCLA|nr:hypothetical protein L6452_17057 [Arctium lappa]
MGGETRIVVTDRHTSLADISETWFVDALNGVGLLSRGLSDSVVIDNLLEPKYGEIQKDHRENYTKSKMVKSLAHDVLHSGLPDSPKIPRLDELLSQLNVNHVSSPSLPLNNVGDWVVSDDDKSEQGEPTGGLRKPSLPLQPVQRKLQNICRGLYICIHPLSLYHIASQASSNIASKLFHNIALQFPCSDLSHELAASYEWNGSCNLKALSDSHIESCDDKDLAGGNKTIKRVGEGYKFMEALLIMKSFFSVAFHMGAHHHPPIMFPANRKHGRKSRFDHGASSGLGELMAYEYEKRGACLAIIAIKEAHSRLEEVAERARVLFMFADVSKVDECRMFVDDTVTHFGRLDHLVANAGIGPFYSIDIDVTKFAPVMASKAALISFYDSLRFEVSPTITITILTLGFIQTDFITAKYSTNGVGIRLKNDMGAVYPSMGAKPCARAIVDGVCKGATSIAEPRFIKALICIKFLFPQLHRIIFDVSLPSHSPTN